MMRNNNDTVVSDQFPRHRRAKSREVSSRFLSPAASATNAAVPPPSPGRALSPTHRKPFDSSKYRTQEESILAHGLWPSSTKRFDTLADHLGNDRLKDVKPENDRPIIGGSLRFDDKYLSSSLSKLPVQSLDENAMFGRSSRRSSDNFKNSLELQPDCESPVMMGKTPTIIKKSGIMIPSKYMNDAITRKSPRGSSESHLPNPVSFEGPPTAKKVSSKHRIQRANSISGGHGSSISQWALSPGRSGSPPMSVESKEKLMSFSSLRPVMVRTPSKGATGMEKLLNLGLDLFKSKKGSISSISSPMGVGVSDDVHRLRLFHNRLVQWRFANAKAHSARGNLANSAEKHLANAWYVIGKLQQSLQQKKLQLQKEKLQFKLNFILLSQLKTLECWGGMERQHLTALSMTKDCLHSVICRVPLIEGAKIDAQTMSMALRQASDLAISIKSMMTIYAPPAMETASLLSELAKVVIQERLLLEEVFELHKTISVLEMEELSLKCAVVQMETLHQQNNEEISVI